MAKLLERSATYEDLLKVPEHLVAELIDGELFTSPRPASRHARVQGKLFKRIDDAFDDGDGGPGGWWIVLEPELHLGVDVMVPDIAGWRRETMPDYPEVAVFEIAPDCVCEVLSPGTTRIDRFVKLPKYASHRVAHVWILDPNNRTLETYRLIGDRYELAGVFDEDEQPIVRAEPFDAIELPLASLCPPDSADRRN